MSFGNLVKDLRIAQKKTLRQFCLDHGHDPSNWSKIERNVNPPPRDEKTLERWAKQLGLKPNTEQWQEFMDLADMARGEIPKHVLTDEELLKKLNAKDMAEYQRKMGNGGGVILREVERIGITETRGGFVGRVGVGP